MTVTTLVDLPFNDDSQQVVTVLSITFTIYTRTSFGLNSAGILATSLFVTKIQRYAQFHFLKIPNFSKKILNCSCRTKHVNNYLYIYGDSFCTLYIVENEKVCFTPYVRVQFCNLNVYWMMCSIVLFYTVQYLNKKKFTLIFPFQWKKLEKF